MAASGNRGKSAATFALAIAALGVTLVLSCSSTTAAPSARSGPWGAACLPSGGESGNPACAKGNFSCYGVSPTDANAFCTMFGCKVDAECPAAWWCADVNVAPNVTAAQEKLSMLGNTRRVCLPRGHCAPCKSDRDCASTQASGETQQHCVPDSQGSLFCAKQCTTNANCELDAQCSHAWNTLCSPAAGKACASDDDCPPANGTYQHCDAGRCSPECASSADCASGQSCQNVGVCTPRAGSCRGDGSFCSPCMSDDDCPAGFCFTAGYSTERFCSALSSAGSCDETALDPAGCPVTATSAPLKGTMCVTVTAGAIDCYGVVAIGPSTAAGCWSVH